nr:hypothetical protein BaRGS_021609 [Batillaria attramentaria]
MATYPGERVQIISVSGLKTKDLTTWLHQQDKATDIESVTFHIGVNDCKSGEVTSLSWDEIIGSCRRVFPNARLHASSIIPAKGRQNINRPIASSNANLHHVCQRRGVVFIDNRSTFVAESGAPRKALYRQDSGDFIHLSIRATALMMDNCSSNDSNNSSSSNSSSNNNSSNSNINNNTTTSNNNNCSVNRSNNTSCNYNTTTRKPIKLRDFDAHIARLHKDANLLFQEEFEDIQENSPKHFTQDFALMDANKVKNRYVNILPFDHTRVKLNSDDDEEFSDFVNANYIPGYSSPREYIATQGPITCTIDDFWRMIWEQKSSIIVMLSDLAEKGRPKVDLYWPTEVNSPVQYGDIIVELTANSTLNKCTIRNFKILMENQEERKVTQYFIPGWEDYGANLSPDDLLDFIKMVRQEARSTQGPITVHCSAGVGRTGTFIALDFLMQFVDDHDLDAEVDIYNLVLNMRHNRPHMVQSEKQYVFIHDALKLIIERKVRAMEEAENEGLYQNTGFQDNVYANQAFVSLSLV